MHVVSSLGQKVCVVRIIRVDPSLSLLPTEREEPEENDPPRGGWYSESEC